VGTLLTRWPLAARSAARQSVMRARYSACWSDFAGNVWLFGGHGYNNGNDLWKFDPRSNLWTLEKGGRETGAAVCGTQGAPAAGIEPGARGGAASWTDGSSATRGLQ
jgi:hypothetical protein